MVAVAPGAAFAAPAAARYTRSDLTIHTDTSSGATDAYKQAFQGAILPVAEIREYELTTYGRAVEQNSDEEFAKLESASKVYASIADDLLAIPVPEDAVGPHLDLANSFAAFAETLKRMAESPEDPVMAFVSMRNFLENEDTIKTAYSQIDIYFTLKEANL
ncbi:MAG: hypothetical protein Q8P16_02330 [bacterium]|nr:hypothetical protein [bacterium]